MSGTNPQKGAFSDLEVNGTSIPAATLAALAFIADAVTGIVSVKQGYQETTECEDYLQQLVGEGQREIDGIVSVWFSGGTGRGGEATEWRFKAELVIRVPRKYSSYMGQAIDLAHNVMDAWLTTSNYTNCEMPPVAIDLEFERIRRVEEAGIAYFTYDITSRGP